MAVEREKALAKLNLTLDVLGKRPDGYHDLRMVMQSVTLCDDLELTETAEGAPRARTNLNYLPSGEKNLAVSAALRFWEAMGRSPRGLEISIQKRIPVCAGLAGGSSDAAAVLRALNRMEGEPFTREELAHIGERVGSDVPYCVLGCTALAEGRGERLTSLPPLPHCWVAECKPDFPVSTPELFGRIDAVKMRRRPDTAGVLAAVAAGDLPGVARRLYNVFEDALPERQGAKVAEIKNVMIQRGALGATMSGSGPTVFGLFNEESAARRVVQSLGERHRETFLAETV